MKKFKIISLAILFSCSGKDNPAPLGFPAGTLTAVASFNANLSSTDPFDKYENEYKAIYASGARGAQTSAPWASLNPTGTTFDFTIITNPYFGSSCSSNFQK